MPNYRRAYVPGGTFFFTVRTASHGRWLTETSALAALRESIRQTRLLSPFKTDAIVILPDHIHAIWTLPNGDSDFSSRWRSIKYATTRQLSCLGGHGESTAFKSRPRRTERGFWQRRFWEHCIRDEDDLNAHLDYIHYNPVKHRVARCPHAWPWSSFHSYVRRGVLPYEWGCQCLEDAVPPSVPVLPGNAGEDDRVL
ncbi:MAG: transposase [Planctomycetota bacterium]